MMVIAMQDIAIRRLRAVPIPKGDGIGHKHKLVVLSELAALGIRVTNPEGFDKASEAFFLGYADAIAGLRKLRGGNVDYVPLFVGFPNDVPDDDAYFAKRLIGYVGNAFELFGDGPQLEHGVVVPEWLFDLRQFGADPITQLQTKSLWDRAKRVLARRKSDEHTEWLDVELVWAEEVLPRLRDWLESCLYARSSIKAALHDDIGALLAHFGADAVEFERIAMKENQALVLRLLWRDGREDAACRLARTPTDLLRLFAALTDTDVSLASPVKFPKLSRVQRRLVLGALEGAPALAEDLKRYRGLWLELGRYIHPGEHRRQCPRVAAAFDALRNGTIATFNGTTEALMAGSDVNAVLAHLATRPGVLGRKLHELLRRFPDGQRAVVDAFATVAANMTVKNLLVLQTYFETINDDEHRTVINKRGMIKVLPNNARGALSADTLSSVQTVLRAALADAVGARDSWAGKTVWIDERLAGYTVPLAQRAASDGLLTVGRGSRIPVDFDKVLRLFVYWKESSRRTDLDLSVIQLDANWRYAGHVSYTNLAEDGIVHSGDLQSARHGAAEFIDITLTRVAGDVRYLAAQVYRFAGDAFADMTCHAGWMVRDRVDAAYQSFDVKTVENKLDLTGRTGYCVPLIVDLEAREIVVTDLYMGTKAFNNNVEGAHGNVARAARQIARFKTTRPTMDTLARLHARARGATIVDHPAADITFGVEGCTFNAIEVERVLSELL